MADGCPVEFAFSTHDNVFRATIEPAAPECPERDRLGAAVTLLETVGLPVPTAERVGDWRAILSGVKLRWGSWLGLRMTSAGPRPKLYIELPPTYPVPEPGMRPRMLGYSPADDASEVYVTVVRPSEDRLRRLLWALAPEAQDRLLEMLASIVGIPLRRPTRILRYARRLADANLPDYGVLTFNPRADRLDRAPGRHQWRRIQTMMCEAPHTSRPTLVLSSRFG